MNLKKRRLFRSEVGMIGGVCEGLGNYFDVDPTIIRLLWVVLALMHPSAILAYLICWIVIPNDYWRGYK